jgi:hypothetical protein
VPEVIPQYTGSLGIGCWLTGSYLQEGMGWITKPGTNTAWPHAHSQICPEQKVPVLSLYKAYTPIELNVHVHRIRVVILALLVTFWSQFFNFNKRKPQVQCWRTKGTKTNHLTWKRVFHFVPRGKDIRLQCKDGTCAIFTKHLESTNILHVESMRFYFFPAKCQWSDMYDLNTCISPEGVIIYHSLQFPILFGI